MRYAIGGETSDMFFYKFAFPQHTPFRTNTCTCTALGFANSLALLIMYKVKLALFLSFMFAFSQWKEHCKKLISLQHGTKLKTLQEKGATSSYTFHLHLNDTTSKLATINMLHTDVL